MLEKEVCKRYLFGSRQSGFVSSEVDVLLRNQTSLYKQSYGLKLTNRVFKRL